jgi:hypothetical protein
LRKTIFLDLDASELALRVLDSETNRLLGTAKVQSLSILSINNPIKGYQSIFTAKGDKLGEIFVSLRIFLPGSKSKKIFLFISCTNFSLLAQDSNENLTAMSVISDVSNPPSRRNSIGANDYNQVCLYIECFIVERNYFS